MLAGNPGHDQIRFRLADDRCLRTNLCTEDIGSSRQTLELHRVQALLLVAVELDLRRAVIVLTIRFHQQRTVPLTRLDRDDDLQCA